MSKLSVEIIGAVNNLDTVVIYEVRLDKSLVIGFCFSDERCGEGGQTGAQQAASLIAAALN